MSGAHAFCRVYLSQIESEVREVLPRSEIGKAWAWKSGQHVEFHGRDDFCWHGRGCCLWCARAEGWIAWLRHRAEGEKSVVT